MVRGVSCYGERSACHNGGRSVTMVRGCHDGVSDKFFLLGRSKTPFGVLELSLTASCFHARPGRCAIDSRCSGSKSAIAMHNIVIVDSGQRQCSFSLSGLFASPAPSLIYIYKKAGQFIYVDFYHARAPRHFIGGS